ncbi:MAG: hypothetical protein JWQ33_1350 [Ramlibacter sp.]|nr:hypothetical protein [Ramlibacter sp.]
MVSRTFMLLAWPAFLGACLLEVLVFAVVDPHDLQWGGGPLGWSRTGACSVAFFAFWAICLVASTLTALLGRATADINQPMRSP